MTTDTKLMIFNTAGRIMSVFMMQAMAIVGGASIIGGIPVWKAAMLSGIASTAQVLQKLAAAYADDGKITKEEIDAAFRISPPKVEEK